MKVIIGTDGASRGNGKENSVGAFGAVLICGNHKKEIGEAFEGVTNNRMELMAVVEALKLLKFPCEVELFSDSRYVCDAVNKNWLTSWDKRGWVNSSKQPVKNKELWQELLPLLRIHKISFNWVKGHADNELNNRCDQICNEKMDEFIRC